MSTDNPLPKYRHYKPKNLGVVPIDGRDYYLGRYDSPKSWEKYHRLLAEHAAKGSITPTVKEDSKPPSGDLDINELIRAYWRHVEGYYVKNDQPTTEACVIRQVLGVVRDLYGHTKAKDFGPLSLKACRNAMVGKGWSRKSINRQAIRIRAMFKWAAANEILPVAIHQALQTVEGLRKGRSAAKERPPVLPVADDVIEKTLAHLSPTVAAMVRLQRLTGMRPQEVVKLRPVDIDMSDPGCWVYKTTEHKQEHNERQRIIFIGPRAIAVLRPFLTLDISSFVFCPRQAADEHQSDRTARRRTPMQASRRDRTRTRNRRIGDHYTVGTYRQAINRACDRAFPHPIHWAVPEKHLTDDQREELKAWRDAHRWHAHTLRHTAGTAIRGQFGLEAAQAVLGHAELRTTQIYGEKSLDAAREVMKAIG